MEIKDLNAIESANWQRRCGELDKLNKSLATELDRQRPVMDLAIQFQRHVRELGYAGCQGCLNDMFDAVNTYEAKDKVKGDGGA